MSHRPQPPVVTGLHHVSVVCGEAEPCNAFYRDTLGLRRVKKTVNFDQPEDHHLYFADDTATPGCVFTAFTDADAPPHQPGPGGADRVVLAAAPGTLDAWAARLASAAVPASHTERVTGAVHFRDPAGVPLGLVERDGDPGTASRLSGRLDHAVLGVARETLDASRAFFREFMRMAETGDRLHAPGSPNAGALVLEPRPPVPGRNRKLGRGGVDHVALRVESVAVLTDLRDRLHAAGHDPTDVKDRKYFTSIYVREPGGCRIEIATAGPGFAVDEPADRMGERLMLPDGLEPRRPEIEAELVKLD